jgi:hypothetical protein
MRKIKFTALGHSFAVGSFSPGDVARLPDDIAQHLVEQARCAQYAEAAEPEPQPPAKRRKTAKE